MKKVEQYLAGTSAVTSSVLEDESWIATIEKQRLKSCPRRHKTKNCNSFKDMEAEKSGIILQLIFGLLSICVPIFPSFSVHVQDYSMTWIDSAERETKISIHTQLNNHSKSYSHNLQLEQQFIAILQHSVQLPAYTDRIFLLDK